MRLLAALCVLLVALVSEVGAVGDCSELCTKYERLVCEAENGVCADEPMDEDVEQCLEDNVPCYLNASSPTNATCFAQFECCRRFQSHGEEERVQMCLRFAEQCVDLTGLALERCVWRIRCNKSQPIARENCPVSQNLCFTRRQQACNCINHRLFNCEITCDLTSSCCLPREEFSSDTCDNFDQFFDAKRAIAGGDAKGDDGAVDADDDDEDDEARDVFRQKLNAYGREKRHGWGKKHGGHKHGGHKHGQAHSGWKKKKSGFWWNKGSSSSSSSSSDDDTTSTTTTTTTTTTKDPKVDTTKNPDCPVDFCDFDEVEQRYSLCECLLPPWYSQEFVQVVMLNYTYVMDLAPVGTPVLP